MAPLPLPESELSDIHFVSSGLSGSGNGFMRFYSNEKMDIEIHEDARHGLEYNTDNIVPACRY
jgi:hypothetical protein